MALLWTRSNRSMSFLCWGLQRQTQESRWGLTTVEKRGRIPSLDLLATLFLMQPRIQLAFWAASAHWWLMATFSAIGTPKSFSAGLLSISSSSSLYWYRGLPWPRCRTLQLAFLNLMRFMQAHFFSCFRSLWMASYPSGMSTASLILASPANLVRVHSISLSRSLMKIFNSIGHSTDPWGTPLVSSVCLDIKPLTTTLWLRPSNQFLIHQTDHLSNPRLSNSERKDAGLQDPGLGWGQWSDTVQWSPRRATAPKHVQAKPERQVSESRSGPDSWRCKTVQTELLHGCTVPEATASAKPRLKSGSEGKGEAGPRY